MEIIYRVDNPHLRVKIMLRTDDHRKNPVRNNANRSIAQYTIICGYRNELRLATKIILNIFEDCGLINEKVTPRLRRLAFCVSTKPERTPR